MFFKFKKGRRTRKHKVALAHRMINDWNKLSTDCDNASNENMFKNKLDIYLIRVG